MQKFTRSLFAVGAVLGLAACGDDVSVTPPQEPLPAGIASVTVAPAQVTIVVGEKVILSASVATTQGTGSPATTVTWSSSNAAIASVAATGEVTGVAAGTTTIVATSTADNSKRGAAAVTVRAPQVQSVTVSPQSLSLQVGQSATAVATVNRDPGASGAVTWASSAPAVATVSATGQIQAVAVGTAVITATSTADNTKSAAMAVTVVAVPNNLTALSVAPTSANLGVGGTVQLVPSATTVGTPTVTYTYQTSNASVATVSNSGLVTAVGNGTAVITTTATTSTNSLSVATTINVASASVSISAITTGGLGTPVNIANVAGQIEVTMNISAGNQTLDSVRVKLGSKSAASQSFTVNGAPNAPVSLSINTAAYTVNADSTATVSFANGSTPVVAELFVKSASGPTASNTITINLNNSDTFHARWNMSSQASAVSSAGFLWYGGPSFNVTVNAIPVMYSGNTIVSATIHLDDASVFGNASLCGSAVVDATAAFTGSFTCTGVTNTTVQPGVAASLRADGNAGPAGVDATGNSSIRFANGAALVQASAVPVRVDVAGPGAATYLFVAPTTNDYWANASFRHDTSSANLLSRARGVDGGVGIAASSTDVYEYEDRAVSGTAWMAHTANTTNIPENPVDFTVNAYNGRVTEKDLLGNATITYLGGGATPGLQNFGVDVSAPTLDYLTATQNALVVLPATDTLGNTKILNDLVNVTGGINSTNGLFGVRMRDTRSGFNVTTTGNSGLFKKIARLGVSGSTCALGGTSCAFIRDTAIVDLTDPTYRRDSVNVYGTLTATTAGYYTYSAYSVDRAGNTSATITKQIAIDITAPVITGLPVPASLVGAQPLSIIPTGLDDLEIWKAAAYLRYPNLTNPLHFPYSVLPVYGTPFDNVLATPVGFSGAVGASGVTLPINFLRGIDSVQTDSTPPAAVSALAFYNPDSLGAQFYDIKRSTNAFAAATPDSSGRFMSWIPTGLVSGTPVPFSSVGVGKWYIFIGGTTGSQIEARALTSTVITNPPFPQVAFFRLSGGTWTYLGKVDANAPTNPTLFDSGTNRFWTYRLTGVSPAVASGQQIIAVGMSAAGDGLSTLPSYLIP